MLSRKRFLGYSVAGFAMAGLPGIGICAAGPLPKEWDWCEHNWALPLDRPLGLVMHGLYGADIDILKLRGFGIILNLFATWCGPCREEAPALEQAWRRYRDRGLRVIGLDYQESDEKVRDFQWKYGITYPIGMDRDGLLTSALLNGRSPGHVGFPATIFISPDGYLYCQKIDSMSAAELDYRINQFLKATPPFTVKGGAAPQ